MCENCQVSDAIRVRSHFLIVMVAFGEFVQARSEEVETVQSDKVKVIEGGREVRVGSTQGILEVDDRVVMRRENEEFGAFRVKANITSRKVGDGGCDFKHTGTGGCLHVRVCAHGGRPV